MANQIQLSYLEQTVYFASLRHGIRVLDIEGVQSLVTISRGHAMKLLAAMARKGALYRVGRGRSVVIPADVLYGRQTFVADPLQVVDELLRREGVMEYYVAYQSAALVYGVADNSPRPYWSPCRGNTGRSLWAGPKSSSSRFRLRSSSAIRKCATMMLPFAFLIGRRLC